MSKKSLFKSMFSSVTRLPWLKQSTFQHKTGVVDVALFSALSKNEFEQLIKKLFIWRGYSISDNKIKGTDLVLEQNQQTTYVQFYQWQQNDISVASVEYIYSLMDMNEVSQGIVISTGLFTEEAIAFALGKKILLINGNDLSKMVEALMLSESEQITDDVAHNPDAKDEMDEPIEEVAPDCPLCGEPMLKRIAKKGRNAGNTFWGCSQFPSCRGVISK